MAADPRKPHPTGDPGDRCPADGAFGRDPARGGDAGAQPHLHLQPDDARPGDRVLADDGERAWPALQCRARRAADLPGGPVADRSYAAALLAAAVAHRRFDARLRPVGRACEPGPDVPARLHVVYRAMAIVPAAAQF